MSTLQSTTCCIAGGGPAGIMLGFLLARAQVPVIVLEKHADFLRDFRGDTIHPSTLQVMDELELLDEVLAITDFRAQQLWVSYEGKQFAGPTFAHLNTKCKFIGFVPQWDFLNLLSERAKQYPQFELRMNTRAADVIRDGDRVIGIRCESPHGTYELRAELVVAADGRSSSIRTATGGEVIEAGVPIDVLWFRLDRPAHDDGHTLAWIRNGQMLVTIPRRSHYQAAMVIRKGAFDALRQRGLDAFRATIAEVCPPLANVAAGLGCWDDVKLLTVQVNRMPRWYEEGLLFIGDAAHAMSPMGGVGINLAIQDAVAAANLLAPSLRNGRLTVSQLQAIQSRREPPARRTQRWQIRMQNMLFGGSRRPDQAIRIPWYARPPAWLLAPLLRRLAGTYIGQGFQPEHVADNA